MSYMAKKTQKRQTTIISLSDSNQQELENIKQQREQMLQEYQEKKQGTVSTKCTLFYKNTVFPTQAEYSYFSADFWLKYSYEHN